MIYLLRNVIYDGDGRKTTKYKNEYENQGKIPRLFSLPDCVMPSSDTLVDVIGFTLIYFKMDVVPCVPETKMADVSILISLGNLLARRTT